MKNRSGFLTVGCIACLLAFAGIGTPVYGACTVGTGILAGNCCKSVTNKHCTDEDNHAESWHFNHQDTRCDTKLHCLASTVSTKDLFDCTCDGMLQCLNQQCEAQNLTVYGALQNGVCPPYIPDGTYITHTACANVANPHEVECVHEFTCHQCGQTFTAPW